MEASILTISLRQDQSLLFYFRFELVEGTEIQLPLTPLRDQLALSLRPLPPNQIFSGQSSDHFLK